jgi:opacity protein-like surface antigen
MAPSGATNPQAGSVQVQATVQIAGVEMGASVKNVQAFGSSSEENLPSLKVGAVPDQSGIGLSLRLGQVALNTDFSEVRKDEGNTERRRSFGLGYSLGSTATLHADYQLVDLDAIGGSKPRTDASVGVNVNVTRVASVSAGMTLEGMHSGLPSGSEGQRTTAGVELRLPWNTFATAGFEVYHPSQDNTEVPSQSAATVGLGYNFAPNGTLLVGYRLIDFGSDESVEKLRQQSLTAGVSLNF